MAAALAALSGQRSGIAVAPIANLTIANGHKAGAVKEVGSETLAYIEKRSDTDSLEQVQEKSRNRHRMLVGAVSTVFCVGLVVMLFLVFNGSGKNLPEKEEGGVHAQHKDPLKKEENAPPKNFTNSIGMKFVWIPPGNFRMGGSPQEEKE